MDIEALNRALARIPQYMVSEVTGYLHNGQPPCRFLRVVLENDLHKAALFGDEDNRACLFGWAAVLDALPLNSWGSPEKVDNYLARRRQELGKPA